MIPALRQQNKEHNKKNLSGVLVNRVTQTNPLAKRKKKLYTLYKNRQCEPLFIHFDNKTKIYTTKILYTPQQKLNLTTVILVSSIPLKSSRIKLIVSISFVAI